MSEVRDRRDASLAEGMNIQAGLLIRKISDGCWSRPRVAPSPVVSAWLDAQPSDALFITANTIAEIGFGIASGSAGRRRKSLDAALTRTIEFFADRTLSFDARAATFYANRAAAAKAMGRGLPTPDGYIATIAASHGFAVATRDTSPFLAGRVEVINPREAQA